MTHPLDKYKELTAKSVRINKPYAATIVKNEKGVLRTTKSSEGKSIVAVMPGTEVAPLPDELRVMFLEEELEPMRSFWITVGTIDPYHGILDWDGS